MGFTTACLVNRIQIGRLYCICYIQVAHEWQDRGILLCSVQYCLVRFDYVLAMLCHPMPCYAMLVSSSLILSTIALSYRIFPVLSRHVLFSLLLSSVLFFSILLNFYLFRDIMPYPTSTRSFRHYSTTLCPMHSYIDQFLRLRTSNFKQGSFSIFVFEAWVVTYSRTNKVLLLSFSF